MRTVIDAQNFTSLDELILVLQEYRDQAAFLGHSSATVYAENKRRVALVEDELSDGSKVLNLFFHDGEDKPYRLNSDA